MKSTILIILALAVGFVAGWSVRGIKNPAQPSLQDSANTKELAKLYPSGLALRALKDMRVIISLNSNDVATARSLLVQDLDIHVSSLSVLSHEVELSEFDKKALQDAQTFLHEVKP
jgi:hypothetical protein